LRSVHDPWVTTKNRNVPHGAGLFLEQIPSIGGLPNPALSSLTNLSLLPFFYPFVKNLIIEYKDPVHIL
jgi:hypothetical protein